MKRVLRIWLVLALLLISAVAFDDSDNQANEGRVADDLERQIWQKVLEKKTTLQNDVDDEPLQLIRPVSGHDRLEVNQLVLEKLAAINDPLSLVAVVGPYHSGKSFLLNVLFKSSRGFSVGANPDPETRGIWIRIIPKDKLVGADGSQVVLVDTEGFYGEGASRIYDSRIFAVSTLLSSHLVYNTLRTLGDAQSVSALADLSKQAHIFNLQNWLHTAHATTTADTTSSTGLDPYLLLETLKFPPLTWVVQGFDIDLQSSQSPLTYLQKFFSAHAQSGDRTLDMLFNQGIDCYTLRTPTDLNALREEVGGEGLAADTELFSTLHPQYRSDVDKLRDGIFGNLLAKGNGNFTGKSISRLIPLLVHYVNEDFPLNAERKLKDVMTDIIVDGSFSGGVQYFQVSMDAFSKTGPKLKSKSDVHEDSELSALAASALSSDELDRIMTTAEKKAIEYCQRRCVGVPQGLTTATCEGQLGLKISRLKPHYRAENEMKVKEVLVLLGEGLRASATKEVDQLQLPIREADLQRQCTKAIQNASRRYESLVGPHRGSHLYSEARKDMQEYIQMKCDRIGRLNSEKISEILNQAKEAYRQAYESGVKSGGFPTVLKSVSSEQDNSRFKPLTPKKLADINLSAVKSAQSAFAAAVKLPWICSGYELYDFHTFQCLQWSKQRYDEIQALNKEHLKSFAEELALDLQSACKEAMNRFSPFPDNDETITEKADDVAKRSIEEYNNKVKEFASFPVVEEKRRELVRSIEEQRSYLLKKNTALMAAFCYDPLMDAYKELNMQDCERSFENMWGKWSFWSAKCLWPGPRYLFGFKHSAFKVARKHLDKAQAKAGGTGTDAGRVTGVTGTAGIVLSMGTRNKVIQAWVEHDLATHANVVMMNFMMLSACGVGGIGCIYLMVRLWLDCCSREVKRITSGASPSRRNIPSDSDYRFSPRTKRF